MQDILKVITEIANKVEALAAAGQLKAAIIAAVIAVLSTFLIAAITLHLISRHRENMISHPAMQDALRISAFYLDRPLLAEIRLEYPSLKARREAIKSDAPACEPRKLERAVWEAEYNEFICWELDNEIRDLKKRHVKAPRGAIRRALKELADTKRRMPHGVTAIFKTKYGLNRQFLYKLSYAHSWLDKINTQDNIPAADKFQSIRANKFQCAWCGSDWNDGARLRVVRTKSGALAPVCARCEAKHDSQN